MRKVIRLFALLILLAFTSQAVAAPTFPPLSGRVVDNANLLDAATKASLVSMLTQHETDTSNQLVVVTLTTLQGYDIADYGYQLGRHWGIGQKEKDNGVLLIVAPNERKVRIEVGYGLEGTLTDKLSHDIIQEQILPYFKKGDYPAGVVHGTKAILSVLNGNYTPKKTVIKKEEISSNFAGFFMFVLFLVAMLSQYFGKHTSRTRQIFSAVTSGTAAIITLLLTHEIVISLVIAGFVYILTTVKGLRNGYSSGSGSSWGGSSSSGGFGGGSFGGGGGSFGGGGASGGW